MDFDNMTSGAVLRLILIQVLRNQLALLCATPGLQNVMDMKIAETADLLRELEKLAKR